jgi:DNA helicase-2/ATP-dependent DNA helicase PcrA
MDTMQSLRGRAEQGVPIGDLLEAVLSQTGYREALQDERTIEAEGRLENLAELVEVAREFDASAEPTQDTLEVFLAQIALVADSDARRDDEGLVTLMTLHNAKGLEYPIVFIIGCEEGVFPHSRALDEGGLEEERRLCYVGITRAMRALYLAYARRRAVFGAQSFGMRSRFIDEIPRELTDREDLGFDDAPILARRGRASVGTGGGGATGSRGGGASSWESARAQAPAVDLALGDDVVHPAFGEGVITAVEPGGVVVVRFAADGSERKLLAEFAPLSRR